MPTFEGCIEAKEISLCPVKRGGGANQLAHALIRKTMATPAATQVENTPMADGGTPLTQADISKAALAMTLAVAKMNDVTRTHFFGLDDAAQLSFLEKSAEEQTKIAEDAVKAAEAKRLEEEAAKSGVSAQYLELQKSNAALMAEVEALKAKQVETDLEKRAVTEFDGYPGGVTAAVDMLKSASKLDDAGRKGVEDLMRAQAQAAKSTLSAFGARTPEEASKAAGAQARIEKKVQEVMAEKKLDHDDAYVQVIEMAEFADDVAALG